MTFYYGSKTPALETVVPGENIKLTNSKMVAAFCLANPLEDPYY